MKSDSGEHRLPLDFNHDGHVSFSELALAIGLGGAAFTAAVAMGVVLHILLNG